jgi:23S rRNA (cytosine1962-C5)-methyltransferase
MNEATLALITLAEEKDKDFPLANRLRKNYRHLRKWAKRFQTDCFRIYDREISTYPLAIDYYAGRFCIQYFSRNRDQIEPSPELVKEVESALFLVFGIKTPFIYWRTRAKSKKTRQYEKIADYKEFFTVHEFGAKFKINLLDYLDTGLFLDHRETRKLVALQSKGKKLLNLFAYTCSFSVHAAVAGAIFTKSVDMSNTYTAWGRDNFKLNSISLENHAIIREDCLKFLDREISKGLKYDIVIIDPPTISRSKKMDRLFDLQVDYVSLITKALKLLSQDGLIFFSTNSRRFIFEEKLFTNIRMIDITSKTIPIDFNDPKIHRCWMISNQSNQDDKLFRLLRAPNR